MSQHHHKIRCLAAFTLVELLVVVAIIALLLGILLPAMSRGREIAKSTRCLSQLRQFMLAASAYHSSNNDFYPPAYYAIPGEGVYFWDFTILWNNGKKTTIPGLLWESQSVDKIHQCPSFTGQSNTLTDPYTGYNYNTSYIGHAQNEGQYSTTFLPTKASHIKNPSMTAIFGDGQYGNGANKLMRAPKPNPGDERFSGRHAGTQGYRHLNQTNIAFGDSHVETWQQRYTADNHQVAEGTGFLSQDNSLYDLK